MALPALRLQGIYLALATAAFAVFLDQWVFHLPDFDVGPIHLGSTTVVPHIMHFSTFSLGRSTSRPSSCSGTTSSPRPRR